MSQPQNGGRCCPVCFRRGSVCQCGADDERARARGRAFAQALADKHDRLLRARDIIERVLLTRVGEVVTPELARERANNCAQALAILWMPDEPKPKEG